MKSFWKRNVAKVILTNNIMSEIIAESFQNGSYVN